MPRSHGDAVCDGRHGKVAVAHAPMSEGAWAAVGHLLRSQVDREPWPRIELVATAAEVGAGVQGRGHDHGHTEIRIPAVATPTGVVSGGGDIVGV